jgi:NTP pyrophosphatase (non-canonical NTP hydrolase)
MALGSDSETTIRQLKQTVKEYCEERDWDQYHNPKDLAIGAITEAAELLEHFRFKSEKEMDKMLADQKKKGEISDEMSDVLMFIIRFAQKYDIDIAESFQRKMDQNTKKYPIDKAKGSNKKYDEL